jgi:hypothetical protein
VLAVMIDAEQMVYPLLRIFALCLPIVFFLTNRQIPLLTLTSIGSVVLRDEPSVTISITPLNTSYSAGPIPPPHIRVPYS